MPGPDVLALRKTPRKYADSYSGYNIRASNGLAVGLSGMGKKKPTIEDIELRVEEVVVLLSKGKRTGEIKKLIGNRYGVKYRQIADYIARARARIYQRRDQDRGEIQADSLAFYEMVAGGGLAGASVRDRIIARKRVDQLLGLDEPRKIHLSGAIDSDPGMRERMAQASRDPSISEDARKLAERLAGIDPDGGPRLTHDKHEAAGK